MTVFSNVSDKGYPGQTTHICAKQKQRDLQDDLTTGGCSRMWVAALLCQQHLHTTVLMWRLCHIHSRMKDVTGRPLCGRTAGNTAHRSCSSCSRHVHALANSTARTFRDASTKYLPKHILGPSPKGRLCLACSHAPVPAAPVLRSPGWLCSHRSGWNVSLLYICVAAPVCTYTFHPCMYVTQCPPILPRPECCT